MASAAASADEPGLAATARALRSGELALGRYYDGLEARCAEREPLVRSLVAEPGRFARLRRESAELERRFPAPPARPPLYGVALGVKDVFHAAGHPTRAGSRLPAALFAGAEAASVSALRRAGALVLGKTVSTEFAYFAPGPTRNPHHLDHTPGGSSSGSAAAVAAGLCALALGTQTIGSLIRPAAYCGVVAFKPSHERIGRAGLVPLAPSLDHVGFFTRDAEGAQLAASLLVGDWRAAAAGRELPLPRLAIPVGPYLERAGAEARRHLAALAERLARSGCAVSEAPVMADFDDIERRHRLIVAAEAARVHAAWFEAYGALYAPQTVELIERGRGVAAAELEAALAGRAVLRAELEAARVAARADLWLTPAAPGAAPEGIAATGDPVMNLPWTYAGLPALALPAGRAESGLPLGVQLVAGFGADEELLAFGRGLESRVAP
jgi:Asp-tRNA(Asn)/Glu-tRNA(Gln) amidotransferase A subunit family amidase